MEKLTQLKAEAYDILAAIEQYSNQLNLLKNKLAEVNKQISDAYVTAQNNIQTDTVENITHNNG